MANIYSTNATNLNLPSSGTISYSANTTAATWATPNTNFISSNSTPIMTIPHGEDTVRIEERATLDVKGNLVINGVDLEERLKTIENVLMIPERDVILEKKHPKLKEMYDAYIQALGKYRTWESLKGDNNGTS